MNNSCPSACAHAWEDSRKKGNIRLSRLLNNRNWIHGAIKAIQASDLYVKLQIPALLKGKCKTSTLCNDKRLQFTNFSVPRSLVPTHLYGGNQAGVRKQLTLDLKRFVFWKSRV